MLSDLFKICLMCDLNLIITVSGLLLSVLIITLLLLVGRQNKRRHKRLMLRAESILKKMDEGYSND